MTAKRRGVHLYVICAGVLVAMCLSACGIPTWQPVAEGQFKTTDGGSLELPSGWMRRGESMADGLMVSRDGVALQYIGVQRLPHEKSFASLSRQSPASVLPSELAELTVAYYKTQKGMETLEIIEEAPATVAGRQGFRLLVGFKNSKGLRYERLTYGFADDKGVYLLSYMAPVLYYFPRDLELFEKTVRSFSL